MTPMEKCSVAFGSRGPLWSGSRPRRTASAGVANVEVTLRARRGSGEATSPLDQGLHGRMRRLFTLVALLPGSGYATLPSGNSGEPAGAEPHRFDPVRLATLSFLPTPRFLAAHGRLRSPSTGKSMGQL